MTVNTTAVNSATTIASHMPSISRNIGSNRTAPPWNIIVRRKEIRADVRPSFRAVKKPEPKMAKPMSGKEKENIRRPFTVIS